MMFISHRRNTIEELNATPLEFGVEVDIRSNNGRLIIHHDPLKEGIDFEGWLKCYKHQTLILNVKEEGLEARLIELMQKYLISDYFFLDQSFPFLVKWSKLGERHCAVRVSEFESIETALALAGEIDWVWVDCFTHFPLSSEDARRLKGAGFKLCLVSPELQGRPFSTEIPLLVNLLHERSICADAICTKQAELWKECLKKIAIRGGQ
ncbi:phosphatidylinositol-specific phospholipase C/glycerophosphodiester phosphodiesterase family protein [Polynucleobacter sp. MWH-Svant-W18]|uniref:phosphatidylinositol-specific phospholipase C/glycerophosphodiester phosphodiesterase family protein n=1 Tax=Polynucleobacter sp. MWH-Svant-W18 TaxID=1855909 RepID=UPI001BFD7882|nr:phosphatidylinositol-specific phospholipase C/glycerophosphodiester phosphodiesterase family protein [Polynucleobacter sp. MWH-Svant-W18]QWD78290.1 hypothetical protein C2757_01675 [Polynucleobacter sp. MWH-Svant-W18]